MRKVHKLSLVFMFCMVALFGFSDIVMAEENPEIVVIEAYNKLAAVKSYHMTMTTKASMTMYGQDVLITVDSNMDVLRQPLLYKNIRGGLGVQA